MTATGGQPSANPELCNCAASAAPHSTASACSAGISNIRESAILGLVGAGGIGLQLQASMSVLAWNQVSLILLVILGTVVVSEWVSAKVRHAII